MAERSQCVEATVILAPFSSHLWPLHQSDVIQLAKDCGFYSLNQNFFQPKYWN